MVALIMEAVRLLTREMEYETPPQDLTVDLGRIPARPASGFVMAGMRPRRPASKRTDRLSQK
jgi:fatty-acid peroxygenase